jgi:hypothetical protein
MHHLAGTDVWMIHGGDKSEINEIATPDVLALTIIAAAGLWWRSRRTDR